MLVPKAVDADEENDDDDDESDSDEDDEVRIIAKCNQHCALHASHFALYALCHMGLHLNLLACHCSSAQIWRICHTG